MRQQVLSLFLIALTFCNAAWAQKWRVEAWKGRNGKITKAAFFQLEGEQAKLLLPQLVDADLLSSDSIERIVTQLSQGRNEDNAKLCEVISKNGISVKAIIESFDKSNNKIKLWRVIGVPLTFLSEESASRAKVLQELIEVKKRAASYWSRELREVGPAISMSYKIRDKFHGMRVTSSEYESTIEKLAGKTYETEVFNRMMPAMVHLTSEMARMARIRAGFENPSALTVQEVQERLQSMSDAFEAGFTGSDDAMHRVLDHAFVEIERLYKNRVFAKAGTKVLAGLLVEFWESVLDECRRNAAPSSEKLRVQLIYNYQTMKALGTRGAGTLKLKNRSGRSLTNVVIKIESSVSTGEAGPTDFYYHLHSFRNNMTIELPPDCFDQLQSKIDLPGFDQGSDATDSEYVFRVSIWATEMHRENIELFESTDKKIRAIPQPGLLGNLRSMQSDAIEVTFDEQT